MVKNTTGGTGTKSLGRKYQSGGADKRLRLPENEFEKYGCVTKLLGNGMCEIHTNDNIKLIGHIRKKMRGKQKRNNLVSALSIVLVGMRDYENPPKNCDIMTIYDDLQVEQIRQKPSINIESLVEMRVLSAFGGGGGSSAGGGGDFEFSMEEDNEPNTKVGFSSGGVEEFKLDTKEDINIDDI